MNRNIHAQIADQKGVDIREASTANFLIDSEDRVGAPFSSGVIQPVTTTCADFIISKNQSLMNGFFTRLAVQEVVFTCGMPNVSPRWSNDQIFIDVSGVGTLIATIEEGFYNVEQYLDAMVAALNALPAAVAANVVFSIIPLAQANGAALRCEVATVNTPIATANNTVAAGQLGIAPNQLFGPALINPNRPANSRSVDLPIKAPDIRGLRYVDFVCSQLTYNQEVKDATTYTVDRDVLHRWYFSYDGPVATDGYGFPILMGYEPFSVRRSIAFPKQIRWSPNQPITNLQFQLYDQNGNALAVPSGRQNSLTSIPANQTPASMAFRYCATSSWEMTLLVSEV